jgi:hypothetical protein
MAARELQLKLSGWESPDADGRCREESGRWPNGRVAPED